MKNKTPFLTGFSTRLFGRSKASAQARTATLQRRVEACSHAGVARMFAPLLGESFMEGLCTSPRRRSFDEVTTFWAWTGQIVAGNSSCSQAVSEVQAWCADSGRTVPSSNTAAYCASRQRLSSSFIQAAHERLVSITEARQRPEDLWRGLTIKAMDGSSSRLLDTPENQEAFPQSPNQKPGCGFPIIGYVAAINLSSDIWLGAATGRWSTHDSTLTGELLHHFGEGDIVLADRAFSSFEIMARLQERGAHSLMRLHPGRSQKLDWNEGQRLGSDERLVTWEKSSEPPKGRKHDPEAWAALPGGLKVRYIRFGYETRLGEKKMMILVTTLTDPKAYPAADVIRLYASRWEIEVKLRDLKTTLKMESFGVRSPEMAQKTLKIMFVAFNLVRSMMQRSAHSRGVLRAEISFKRSLDMLLAWKAMHRGRRPGRSRKELLEEDLLELLASKKLPRRPGRREPRAVKLRSKSYSKLTRRRGEFKEAEQRTTRRKDRP